MNISMTMMRNFKQQKNMKNLLYTFAAILIAVWAIGFFGYHSASVIHLLLVNAVLLILIRILPDPKPYSESNL